MNASDEVIVVVPIYQNNLSELEKISLCQLAKILGGYPFALVTFETMNTDSYERLFSEYRVLPQRIFFDPNYFNSISGYNQLLTSMQFYKKFECYSYILVVQLDVFVFSDKLTDWCRRGYDFVGAPWLEGFNDAVPDSPFVGVGNGGFSLRKVESALRILKSFSYIQKPRDVIRRFFRDDGTGLVKRLGRVIRDLSIANNTFSLFNNYSDYEDHFWGTIAKRNFKWYRVPDPDEALKFSMEVQPRSLYERNGSELPFGCHAWWRYDLEFWRPFIEKEGHVIPASGE